MAKIKAVVFDLWFTLIPGTMNFPRILGLIGESGLSLKDFIRTYERVLMTKNYSSFEELHADFIRAFPHQNTKISEAELQEVFFNRIQKINFYPDVVPCLQLLKKQRYQLGLLSNMESIMIPRIENELNPELFFDVIGYSSQIHAIKPDPKAFDFVLTKLGVSPQEALMVGDSYHSDIVGGQEMGMHTCLIKRVGNKISEGIRAPEFEISSLDELPRVLKVLNTK